MPRGGFRPGAGRPKGSRSPEAKARTKAPADVKRAARKSKLSPLEYMLDVLNDPEAGKERRDRMAIAAAPFVHIKPGDAPKGKKEERQEAAERANSKFAVPQPPQLKVVGGDK